MLYGGGAKQTSKDKQKLGAGCGCKGARVRAYLKAMVRCCAGARVRSYLKARLRCLVWCGGWVRCGFILHPSFSLVLGLVLRERIKSKE